MTDLLASVDFSAALLWAQTQAAHLAYLPWHIVLGLCLIAAQLGAGLALHYLGDPVDFRGFEARLRRQIAAEQNEPPPANARAAFAAMLAVEASPTAAHRAAQAHADRLLAHAADLASAEPKSVDCIAFPVPISPRLPQYGSRAAFDKFMRAACTFVCVSFCFTLYFKEKKKRKKRRI